MTSGPTPRAISACATGSPARSAPHSSDASPQKHSRYASGHADARAANSRVNRAPQPPRHRRRVPCRKTADAPPSSGDSSPIRRVASVAIAAEQRLVMRRHPRNRRRHRTEHVAYSNAPVREPSASSATDSVRSNFDVPLSASTLSRRRPGSVQRPRRRVLKHEHRLKQRARGSCPGPAEAPPPDAQTEGPDAPAPPGTSPAPAPEDRQSSGPRADPPAAPACSQKSRSAPQAPHAGGSPPARPRKCPL